MSFALKRAHWSAVGFGTRLFKEAKVEAMTPSRFDLLYLIHKMGPGAGRGRDRLDEFATQGMLVEMLGVRRPTVSRMVARLEVLGLVVRSRSETDRRVILVTMTDLGKARFRAAMQVVFAKKEIAQLYERMARRTEPGVSRLRRWQRLEAMFADIDHVHALAQKLGNTAERFYRIRLRMPWSDGTSWRSPRRPKWRTPLEWICIQEGDSPRENAYGFLQWVGRGCGSGVPEPWYRPRRLAPF